MTEADISSMENQAIYQDECDDDDSTRNVDNLASQFPVADGMWFGYRTSVVHHRAPETLYPPQTDPGIIGTSHLLKATQQKLPFFIKLLNMMDCPLLNEDDQAILLSSIMIPPTNPLPQS